jgi:hypothetical protein
MGTAQRSSAAIRRQQVELLCALGDGENLAEFMTISSCAAEQRIVNPKVRGSTPRWSARRVNKFCDWNRGPLFAC